MRTSFSSVVQGLLRGHGRQTAALVVAPGVIVFILGLLFGGGFRGVGIAVVNHDQGFDMPFVGPLCMTDRVIAKLDAVTFAPTPVASMEAAQQGVRNGTYAAIVEFPEDFTKELLISREDPTFKLSSKVRLLVDQSNAPVAAAVTQGMMNAFLAAAADSGAASIPLERSPIGGRSATFFDFLVTGIIVLLTFVLAAMLPMRALARERAADGSFASVREQGAIAAGSFAVFGAAAFVQAGLVVAAALAAFPLTLSGNTGVACLVFALHVTTAVLVGIACSRLTATPSKLIPLLVSPLLFAGITIPLETLPVWIRPIAYMYPHYYTIHGVRGSLMKGFQMGDVIVDLVVLACFLVVFAVLALLPKRAKR